MRVGRSSGVNRTYEVLRRWLRQSENPYQNNRLKLVEDLPRLSRLYGILTGMYSKHPDAAEERQHRHLRQMGIHTQRPLTLRCWTTLTEKNPERIVNL